MRPALASVIGAAVAVTSTALAWADGPAQHGPRCQQQVGVVGVSARPGAGGSALARLCVRNTPGANFSVTVRRAPGRRSYAVYQGEPGDTVPSGYVGADDQDGVTIVGCDTGTYDPKKDDRWNQRPNSSHNNAQIALGADEFTAPTGPVGPGDPCSPFVPHTPPGKSCGSPRNQHPATVVPGKPSPLNGYLDRRPAASGRTMTQVGLVGDFGGGNGASGYLQVTVTTGNGAPEGNVTTGGNSRGGGGTVAVGNDGNETDDPYTPAGSPVVVCQD